MLDISDNGYYNGSIQKRGININSNLSKNPGSRHQQWPEGIVYLASSRAFLLVGVDIGISQNK